MGKTMMTKKCARNDRGSRRLAKGFTLIELLLVVAILAILASVVVPRFAKRSEQARNTAAATDIANIGVALDAFEVDCGRYPTTEEGLKALVEQPSSVKNWNSQGYLKSLKSDPWGNPYQYRCPGTHNAKSYDLLSLGPDGQEGTADDIDNWSDK
jgi:general secretion pathway protein G